MNREFKIDYSQISCFQSCHRKFANKYIECLRKIKYDFRNIDLEFGKTIHKCLEEYYKGKSWAEIILSIAEFQDLETEKVKTRANLLRLMEQYIPYYSGQDKAWQVLGTEINDTFKIQDMEYTVKIDLIIKENENVYVVDHKTTKTNRKSTYFQQFEPNTQVTGYTAYCQSKYGQCSGFIPNVMFVGFRERKYKGEEAGFHCEFERAIINRYPQQIEDFKVNVMDVVKQIEDCRIKNYWAKTEGNCMYCEFKELCISCNDEQILNTLYQVVDNPLEYLTKGDTNEISEGA